jgi:predicted nucleic acid-binding protein
VSAGLLDTSVVIDWHDPDVLQALPDQVAISAVTLAELAAGPHLASTPAEAARRQVRLQEVESKLEPLALDADAARSYGQIVAAAAAPGGTHRMRIADLMIAAIAHSNGLDLYTRNSRDFTGLDDLIKVVGI